MDWVLNYLLALGMGIIMFAVVYHVFGRYFVGITHMGTMELVRYTMVWVAMLGAAVAFGAKDHVSIAFFKSRIPRGAWFLLNLTGNALLCLFLVCMVVGGIEISIRNMNQTSLGLQIPMFYPYLSIPVGGCLMLPYILTNFLGSFIKLMTINGKSVRTI